MLCVVTKRFNAHGEDLKIGDVVETGGWKNERLLLEHRYIARTDAPQSTPSTTRRAKGRKPSLLDTPIKGSRRRKPGRKKASKREV